MEKNEVRISDMSKAFALRIINLYRFLTEDKKEYILSKQIVRSGTSIGANVRESQNAQSRLDFISKLNIALKESNETEYWLELLHESGYITDQQFESIYKDCKYIVMTLVKIIKTTKRQQ